MAAQAGIVPSNDVQQVIAPTKLDTESIKRFRNPLDNSMGNLRCERSA